MERRWENMEFDCLVSIFSLLRLDDLTASIPFVCKSWSQAASDPACWRTLDFRPLDLKPSSTFAKRLASQYSVPRYTFSGFLKLAMALSRGAAFELCFSPLFPASMEVLARACADCPRLRVLGLPRIGSDDEGRFVGMLGKWKELERLEMESKPSRLPEMVKEIGLRCSRFQGLKVRGWIKNEDVAAILDFLPNLQSLDLSGCRVEKAQLLRVTDGCQELKLLSVKDCFGLEVDEEVKRGACGIEVFNHEGCRLEDNDSGSAFSLDDDELEQMMLMVDGFDCLEMWMF
ncbi:hypothetical protein HPP92_018102 [Vanilla planifolia]|uniref:F-box domain-containing protein n=1 Tax=Vanilla planifolia TaxID=51239 RepID=A0A835UNL3_VANPL|nr:hypothetical protein HPP92_018690 [Vanilla planifolia]KAG0468774.1 hypothetical protein HPP92_018102 [Vanilla planifolia]